MNMLEIVALALVVAALLLVGKGMSIRTVHTWESALLYINGRFDRRLATGRLAIFRPFAKVETHVIHIADQLFTSGAVDVTSGDKLSFRMTAAILYKVHEPQAYFERNGWLLLQQAVTAGLTQVAAAQPLEELLSTRTEVGARLAEAIRPALPECEILNATITGLQLPPEIRRMFAEIEKAKLEGRAALERARAEQAALRSLANAARLLKDNPELTNLRLLQSVAGANRGSTTLVLGQGALVPSAGGARPSDDAPDA